MLYLGGSESRSCFPLSLTSRKIIKITVKHQKLSANSHWNYFEQCTKIDEAVTFTAKDLKQNNYNKLKGSYLCYFLGGSLKKK